MRALAAAHDRPPVTPRPGHAFRPRTAGAVIAAAIAAVIAAVVAAVIAAVVVAAVVALIVAVVGRANLV